jgi:surface antigen
MAIDTHLDATPSEITSSATAIGNIETHVDSAEDDLISARRSVAELEGETALNASISISTGVNDCEDLVSDLKSYKNALTNFATAMGKVKSDLEGIRSRATAGGLTVNGESIEEPKDSFPLGPDSSNSVEVRAFDEEQEKITLYKTLDTDTSHIRDRETEARQTFTDACTRITDGHPVTQKVAGTVGGYFAPDTKKGGWQAAAGVGTWAIGRVGDGVKMVEARGLRASGANVTRTVGGKKVVFEAGGKGTRQWRHALNDAKLSNWSVPKGAEGTRAAKAVDMARKVGSSNAMKYAGRAGAAVSFGVDAYQQWEKDSHNPSIGTGEKVARAATAGAGSAAGGWAGAQAGAAVGACVGGPVGAVVGGAVGAAVGSGVGKGIADWVNTKTHGLFH